MVERGLTVTLPDVAPPVSKFVPTQAAVEDHVRVVELPVKIDEGLADNETVGETVI